MVEVKELNKLVMEYDGVMVGTKESVKNFGLNNQIGSAAVYQKAD